MSVIESLFVMDLEVLTAGSKTSYGKPAGDWSSPTPRSVTGWVSQETRDEELQYRDAQVDTWRLYLPWGDPITAFNRVRIVDTGQVLEVAGPPQACLDPEGPESHVECTLRMVTG